MCAFHSPFPSLRNIPVSPPCLYSLPPSCTLSDCPPLFISGVCFTPTISCNIESVLFDPVCPVLEIALASVGVQPLGLD